MSKYTEITADHGELRIFTKGQWVEWAQDLLQRWGWNIGPKGVDGYFGPDTEAAVKAFQRDNGSLGETGVVDAQTWRALEAAKIVFHTFPVANADRLEWTIVNEGFTVRPAGRSAGHVTVMDRKNGGDVVPEAPTPQGADLGAGDTFDAGVDLLATFPPDGEYTAQVRLKLDLALVDFDVVGGKVVAPGTFATQTQPVATAYPPDLKLDGEPTFYGNDFSWRVQNAGPGPLPANSAIGEILILDRDSNTEIVPLKAARIGYDLPPGGSDGYTVPLDRLTQNDGKYQLALIVNADARLVDYDIVRGDVWPVVP
jgi:peptidoglycan hydrolase-like protein with peptidoglycan-binding domain